MKSNRFVLFAATVAAAVAAVCGPVGALSAAQVRRVAEHVKLANYPLNRHIRMLDGQWQGTFLASDGNVYVGGGSHNPDLGAALFRYEPKARALKMLVDNITPICGEDQTKTPPQGKLHSPIVEHEGWIYLGTHLANYTEQGRKAYTGAHLLGYHLATGQWRDFGVIHQNFTNYSALGLYVARAATRKIEAHADALPEEILTYASRDPWRGLRALDEHRALIHMAGKMWIFDSRQAPRGEATFTPIRDGIDPSGLVECFAYGGGRFFWTFRGKDRKAPLHLMSASVKDPGKAIDHGEIVDGGRRPMWAGDLITDGQGTVYMVGRWHVTDEDMKEFGMVRHKMQMAVFFSVIDVSAEIE